MTRRSRTVARSRARARKIRERLIREKRQARTLLLMGRFLKEFRENGNILRSAELAGIERRTVQKWRKLSPEFEALYGEALDDALDRLEEEARRRAVDGVDEPLVSAGKLVCHVRKYSDQLLTVLLKGKRPDTFRERHEFTGKDGGPMITVDRARKMTDEELVAATELELAKLKAVVGRAPRG
jgi:hypothetical protein